ncbi:MAG: hypothetical protein B9S36_00800 [Verrucomicrobiia bacterium Tous-C2TDCM]|nr:MAG: hypothetical protein B9S36_00800 [Verrucomicrobiae bacterium Tous-C2TDCM]
MPFLVILKRFEVWLLLAIVAALIGFALQPPPPLPGSREIGPEASPGEAQPLPVPLQGPQSDGIPAATTPPTARIREVHVTPSSSGYIVETLISRVGGRATDLVAGEDQVRATTTEGQPVNRFFEPFQATPALLASGDSVSSLRWWLPAPAESIWIEIDGERIEARLP